MHLSAVLAGLGMVLRYKSSVPGSEENTFDFISGAKFMLTNEVIWGEEVIVPDLHGEDGRQVPLSLSQTVEVILTPIPNYIAPIYLQLPLIKF